MCYTYYVLFIGDGEDYEVPERRREQILDWLEWDESFRCELENFHERGMNGYARWYEHDQDLLRLSNTLPEVLFVLLGEGEEPEDLWKCYYLGGRMQETPARVEYPPFDGGELVE